MQCISASSTPTVHKIGNMVHIESKATITVMATLKLTNQCQKYLTVK